MIETMADPLTSSAGHGTNHKNTLGRRKSRPAPQPPTRNPAHPLERLLEELAIRNPSDLVIGIAKTVATKWRHQPQHLLRPGVCYEAQVSKINLNGIVQNWGDIDR